MIKKSVEDHLPKRAPKKSGKRGIGPAHDPDHGKTSRLPGMEDAAIEDLENAAREYANLRDNRLQVLKDEVAVKEDLLLLMKSHHKEKYTHDGIEIRLVHEKENVKVKIKKDEDSD